MAYCLLSVAYRLVLQHDNINISIYLYLIMYVLIFSDVALEIVKEILSKTRPLTSITKA